MGRNTLRLEDILKKRELDGDWPRQFWDYTEWEEALHEYDVLYSHQQKRNQQQS